MVSFMILLGKPGTAAARAVASWLGFEDVKEGLEPGI
jgi:hypothetical protein